MLFVSSRNRKRSLTAEHVFHGVAGHEARSAGTEAGARVRVTAGHIGWAEIVFVMEKRHLQRLQQKYQAELADRRVVCLHIADDFEYMDDDLVERLHGGVASHVPLDDGADR